MIPTSPEEMTVAEDIEAGEMELKESWSAIGLVIVKDASAEVKNVDMTSAFTSKRVRMVL
ncbi:hypothetical protein FRC02_003755 [Tulasnella sp. 418]|nr:hypothetical protein FRC02_003755 [Tulasnella sp. 418]